uniref:Dauer Up-Regulated n=1 Tax=Caenorhabditis tropicalis TaxID=1561998 RepID=A0A1I7TQZ0_9PELO
MADDILCIVAQIIGYSILGALTIAQCGGKKEKEKCPSKMCYLPISEKYMATKKSDKKEDASGAPKPDAPKAPTDKNAVAGTHDPNYQTLAGVDANVFQEKGGAAAPAAGGAAPAAGAPKAGGPGMAATHDPNYQTLAGIGNDCFDKKDGAKPAAGGAAAPAAPKAGGPGMAATHDPNYQTLAGIGNDCFQKK